MTSIHDVARLSGVSIATVSRALRGLPNVSPQTRELVQAAAAELHYTPSPTAAGLSSGRHRAIAIVVPSMGRWFYTKVFEGVDTVLRREGYDGFIINLAAGPDDRERLFHNALLRKRADGVVALGIDFTPAERAELRSVGMPLVVVGAPVAGVRSIGLDDLAAATAAMGHLLDAGHRRIGHVGGTNEYGMDHSVGIYRSGAWSDSLLARGIEPRPEWSAIGAFLMPQAKIAATAMLARDDRPTAVFAASDEMGFGVLLAAAELGLRVPEDLSVIGIDDHDWSASFGLTTIHQDPFDQGRTAAEIVLGELAGLPDEAEDGDAVIHAPFTLVHRRSTAPLGAGRPAAPPAAPPTHRAAPVPGHLAQAG